VTTALGIDVGSSAVKAAVVVDGGALPQVLGKACVRIRRRELRDVVRSAIELALADAGLGREAIDYLASTGEGESVAERTGHFYSMTTHARGGLHLVPDARAVLDLGALHGRVIRIDERGKVLDHRMTSQCASGSGQFLENISRYLGIPLDEVGALSRRAANPEPVSSICAVLAETDVINMVSRGISTPDILKGIHLSMAGRLLKLVRSSKVQGVVALTGGLARDEGLVAALIELAEEQDLELDLRAHPDSALAGAIGAGIWGAFRRRRLDGLQRALHGA
jgi:benzoyl-CoA reductase subunit D